MLTLSFSEAGWLQFTSGPNNPRHSNLTAFYNKTDVGTDWIGIYKEGSSVAWRNVIAWTWVKNLKGLGTGDKDRHWLGIRSNLPEGNYEARLFENNSYIIEHEIKFEVQKNPLEFKSFTLKSLKNTASVSLFVDEKNKDRMGEKDWIGLYKADSSNNWGNVVKWIWAKDLLQKNGTHKWTDIENGIYEVRYFLNNSTNKAFKVSEKVVIDANEINLETLLANYYRGDKSLSLGAVGKECCFVDYNPTDWIAIYKKESSNSWKNVIKWTWVKDLRQLGHIGREQERALIFENLNLDEGEYEVRYFLNNSYRTYAKQDIRVIAGTNPYLLDD